MVLRLYTPYMACSIGTGKCSLAYVWSRAMSQAQRPNSARRRIAVSIRRLRSIRGLSQEALAQRSSLSPRHLQKMEAGEVNVTIESLSRVADALSVDISELFKPVTGDSD